MEWFFSGGRLGSPEMLDRRHRKQLRGFTGGKAIYKITAFSGTSVIYLFIIIMLATVCCKWDIVGKIQNQETKNCMSQKMHWAVILQTCLRQVKSQLPQVLPKLDSGIQIEDKLLPLSSEDVIYPDQFDINT